MCKFAVALAAVSCVAPAFAATLEKLSLDEMSAKSTLIVRGKILSCGGDLRGSVIYTRCKVSVTDRWKGTSGLETEFVVPGGTRNGLTQTFTGTPKFFAGQEYVLFLWTGRSGVTQVIGLSQGVFDLKADAKGSTLASRAVSAETMLDSRGNAIEDERLEMKVNALRARVRSVIEGSR